MSQIALEQILTMPDSFMKLIMRGVVIMTIFGIASGLSGCLSPQRTLLGESRSPDGGIVARVYRNEPSGIGTGDANTVVVLNSTTGNQSPMVVLAFDDGLDSPQSDKRVEIKWVPPSRLELTYTGPRHIGFQAVKWRNVDILVRERSSTSG